MKKPKNRSCRQRVRAGPRSPLRKCGKEKPVAKQERPPTNAGGLEKKSAWNRFTKQLADFLVKYAGVILRVITQYYGFTRRHDDSF